MGKGGNARKGKLVMNGHTAMLEGLADVVSRLEAWEEVKTIRVGTLSHSNLGRRRSLPRSAKQGGGLRRGGGFRFRAKGWAQAGELITGIRCRASYGRSHQEVILTGANLSLLWERLAREGYFED